MHSGNVKAGKQGEVIQTGGVFVTLQVPRKVLELTNRTIWHGLV